jgi:hypothetical protein
VSGPLRLTHYTCDDGAPLIAAAGVLRPNPHPLLPDPLVWATDLRPGDVPDLAAALGLTGQLTTCNRTAHHFQVLDPGQFEPWPVYARREVRAGRLDREAREAADGTPGGMPRHWWVTTRPALVAVNAGARR